MIILSEEQWEDFERLAGNSVDIRKIAIFYEQDPDEWEAEFNTPGTELRRRYDKGMIMKEMIMKIKLTKDAENGSITAIQTIQSMIEQRKMEIFKERLLNGT
ncbi:MAG: hypothetical protein ACOYMF_05210 [Bacteroidales bacterium]